MILVLLKNMILTYRLIEHVEHSVGMMIKIYPVKNNKCKISASYDYGINDFIDNIEYLVERYIRQNAEYCVNICSFTRMSILNKFNDFQQLRQKTVSLMESESDTILMLITIFDEALQEIISLLKADSLSRFYQTKEYKLMITKYKR